MRVRLAEFGAVPRSLQRRFRSNPVDMRPKSDAKNSKVMIATCLPQPCPMQTLRSDPAGYSRLVPVMAAGRATTPTSAKVPRCLTERFASSHRENPSKCSSTGPSIKAGKKLRSVTFGAQSPSDDWGYCSIAHSLACSWETADQVPDSTQVR